MSYKETMYEAIAEYLRQVQQLDVEKVVDFEEVEKSDGYCETCYYEWTEVDITFVDKAGATQKWNYYGSFAEFVRNIT